MSRQPLFVALVLTVPSLVAQDPPVPPDRELLESGAVEVATRLGSEEPADVAWGAHLAGRLRLREAVPQLRRELVEWTGAGHDDARYARLYLLDALVRLGAVLPGEELAPQLSGYLLPPALILAARDPEAHGPLLFALVQSHWQQGDPDVRLAAGNLLAATKAPGFAAWLLPRLPLRLHVTVRDVDPTMIGVGTGGAGSSIRSRVVSLPAAYPPVPRYDFTTQAAHGARVLAPGTRTVFWRRSEDVRRGLRMSETRSSKFPPGPSVHRWLAQMARTDLDRLGLPLFSSELVRWRDAASFQEQVGQRREVIADAFAKLSRALVLQRAMTDAEASTLSLPLRVEVVDERVDRSAELPALPQLAGGRAG